MGSSGDGEQSGKDKSSRVEEWREKRQIDIQNLWRWPICKNKINPQALQHLQKQKRKPDFKNKGLPQNHESRSQWSGYTSRNRGGVCWYDYSFSQTTQKQSPYSK